MELNGVLTKEKQLSATVRVTSGGGSSGGAVTSVNGQTGDVVLDAEDVGALPDSTTIPTATSDLTNDSGFVDTAGAAAAAPVQSVAGKTGRVTLNKSDVGLDNVDNTSDANKPISTAAQAALDGKADKVAEVTVSTAGAVTQALYAGKIYHFTGELTALTITLNAPASGDLAQYHFDFLSGSTAPALTMPSAVTMPDSFTVEAGKRYEIDVLNNYGEVAVWANS